MNKREYCESRESIAYYSGLNGLEIKGIEYGINDYIYCVSGAWGGGKAFHRCKIQYTRSGAAFFREIEKLYSRMNGEKKVVQACI